MAAWTWGVPLPPEFALEGERWGALVVDVHPDHAGPLGGQLAARLLKPRRLSPAGSAPGSPEVQHHHLAPQAGQVEPPAVQGLAGDGGEDRALASGDHHHPRCQGAHLAGLGFWREALATAASEQHRSRHPGHHDDGGPGEQGSARHGPQPN